MGSAGRFCVANANAITTGKGKRGPGLGDWLRLRPGRLGLFILKQLELAFRDAAERSEEAAWSWARVQPLNPEAQ